MTPTTKRKAKALDQKVLEGAQRRADIARRSVEGVSPREERLPDAAGWWARRQSGRVKWFRVDLVEDEDGIGFCIYNSDTEKLVNVEEYSTPLTRWYGPVTIPKDD